MPKLILFLLFTLFFCSCTPDYYARQADRDVQSLIQDREKTTLGYTPQVEAPLPILATARDVAHSLGNTKEVARLDALIAKEPRTWRDTRTHVYGSKVQISLATEQSDEIPPYVEIYVDDLRRAEGEVRDERTFDITAHPGLHAVEVRLVNPRTRNGIQRRLRLS